MQDAAWSRAKPWVIGTTCVRAGGGAAVEGRPVEESRLRRKVRVSTAVSGEPTGCAAKRRLQTRSPPRVRFATQRMARLSTPRPPKLATQRRVGTPERRNAGTQRRVPRTPRPRTPRPRTPRPRTPRLFLTRFAEADADSPHFAPPQITVLFRPTATRPPPVRANVNGARTT
jgi:hypothetical protein